LRKLGAVVQRLATVAAVLSMTGLERDSFVEGGIPFLAVAQPVGFGLGRSKMLYLSIGID
jgi:hypothetical protein